MGEEIAEDKGSGGSGGDGGAVFEFTAGGDEIVALVVVEGVDGSTAPVFALEIIVATGTGADVLILKVEVEAEALGGGGGGVASSSEGKSQGSNGNPAPTRPLRTYQKSHRV